MKPYEKIARYFLGGWSLFGAVDGWAYLLFDYHLFQWPPYSFYGFLMRTTWFMVLLKVIQTAGALSLLLNYKPALGLALVTPICAVLCVYYLTSFSPFTVAAVCIAVATAVLLRAYARSFTPLLASYPR
jgi:hypothetical protein